MNILIVDDEAHIAMLLEQTLEDFEDAGATISKASNGEEALGMIRREKPDLVFLDIMIPLINGYDICHTVKNEWKLSTYIIIVTARGEERDRIRALESGADLFITKPFDPDQILDITSRVLGIQPGGFH